METEPKKPSLESSLQARLHHAIQDLYGHFWATEEYDARLGRALNGIMDAIGATAFMASHRSQKVNLYCPVKPCLYRTKKEKPADHAELQKFAVALVRDTAAASPSLKKGESSLHSIPGREEEILLLPVTLMSRVARTEPPAALSSTASRKSIPQEITHPGTTIYSVLIYRLKDAIYQVGLQDPAVLTEEDKSRFLAEYRSKLVDGLLCMLVDAFRYRETRFAAFPPEIVERYWNDALKAASDKKSPEDARKLLQPPWDGRRPHQPQLVTTATLSLDLRKSTYCMEYARSEKEFGSWLDHFVEKMRAVAHLHGGVFDKFTGDGALVHFLERECRTIYRQRAVDAAVHCAVDMQRAVEIHMRTLRKILHHDSPIFGAGIAVDIGKAFWSFDHDMPIVVGKGVVGACRVGDKAPRQTVRLTNAAYWALSGPIRELLCKIKIERKSLATKEVPDALELECWQFSVTQELNIGKGPARIEQLCQEIKKRFDAEKAPRKRRT